MTEGQGAELLAALDLVQRGIAIGNGLLYGLVLVGSALLVVGLALVLVVGITRPAPPPAVGGGLGA